MKIKALKNANYLITLFCLLIVLFSFSFFSSGCSKVSDSDKEAAKETTTDAGTDADISLLDSVKTTILLYASSASIVANAVSSAIIFAEVKGPSGEPVDDGVTVTFSTDAGDIDPDTEGVQTEINTTTEGGLAQAILTSSTNIGMATVTANTEGFPATTSIEFVPGPPFTLSLEASPDSMLADGISQSIITALVLDAHDNPVLNGTTLIFKNLQYGKLSNLVVTTTDGRASTIYTAPDSSDLEKVTITAYTTNGVQQKKDITISLQEINIAGLELTADPDSLPANGTSKARICATVTLDGGGLAPDGIQVTFEIEGEGSFEESGDSTFTKETIGGKACIILISSNTSGVATIKGTAKATSREKTNEIQVTYAPGSVEVSIVPNSLLGTGEETANITVTLKDASGNTPNDDPNVMITLNDRSLGMIEGMNNTGQITKKTSNGQAQVNFTAFTKEGTATITGTWKKDDAEIKGSASIDIQPSPADIQIAEGFPDPTSISVKGTGGTSTTMITFDIWDSRGGPVPDGYRIDFTIENGPNGGESIIPISAKTENGQVSTILRSGTKSGPVSIKAAYHYDGTITTTTSLIAIHAGPPVGEEFGIAAQYRNVAGWWIYFIQNPITIGAGDKYGNAIPDNTAISFKTYNTGGYFAPGSSSTLNGLCTSTHYTNAPKPLQGFVSLTGEAVDGGRTTHVTSITVSPFDEHIIYAGTNGGGVYKSLDEGASWYNTSRSSTMPGQNWIDPYINDISVDPDNRNTIYAATGYLGKGNVFCSLDGGLNWNSNNPEKWNGIFSSNKAVLAILCDGIEDEYDNSDYPYVWIGTEGAGALYSKDGICFQYGGEVIPIDPTEEEPPGSGHYINANNYGEGYLAKPILSSTSKTEEWTAEFQATNLTTTTPELSTDNSKDKISYDGGSGSTITDRFHSAGGNFYFESDNKGSSYFLVTLRDYDGSAKDEDLELEYDDPNEPSIGTLAKYLEQGYYSLEILSADSNWSIDVIGNLGKGEIEDLSATSSACTETWTISYQDNDNWTVEGSQSGSQDNAETDELYTSNNGEISFTITSTSVNPYHSGDTWTFDTMVTGNWLVSGNVSGIQEKYAFNDMIYESDGKEVTFIINEEGLPFKEEDTFNFKVEESGLGHGKTVKDLARVPGDTHGENAILYAATAAGVYRSNDGGKMWEKTSSFTGNSITKIVIHPSSPPLDPNNHILYVGTSDAGVWFSYNGGKTWEGGKSVFKGLEKGISATTPLPDPGINGNGTMTEVMINPNAQSEKWTLCYDPDIPGFSVSGSQSVDPNRPPATVGQVYDPNFSTGPISFTIYEGIFPFQSGDKFTFTTTRDPGVYIKDLLLDHVNKYLYTTTYFEGISDAHAVGNVYRKKLNTNGTFVDTNIPWEETNEGLPEYDPPEDKTLFAMHSLALDDPLNPSTIYIGGDGISLHQSNLDKGTLSWRESKIGLTNLIMTRMPILFSGECHMEITKYDLPNDIDRFMVYIQDENGNPPVAGSVFLVEQDIGTEITKIFEVKYGDCYIHAGTFRDPSDKSTDIPYFIEVQRYPGFIDNIILTFTPLENTSPEPPGNSGAIQVITY